MFFIFSGSLTHLECSDELLSYRSVRCRQTSSLNSLQSLLKHEKCGGDGPSITVSFSRKTLSTTVIIFIPISKGDVLKLAQFSGKCMVRGGKIAHIKLFTAVNWVIASQKKHLCGGDSPANGKERKDRMKIVSMLPR